MSNAGRPLLSPDGAGRLKDVWEIPAVQPLLLELEGGDVGQKPRQRTIDARDLVALGHEIRLARQRFGLAVTVPVKSCYEAGREGFWLHRYLTAEGIDKLVVDPASIEVKRRERRRKTDRLDLEKLLQMLVRYHLGDKRVWSVVQVPGVAAEDARQLQRKRFRGWLLAFCHADSVRKEPTWKGRTVAAVPCEET